MEQIFNSIILGIIQGLTEWLPISSTGHLNLAENFLGLSVPFLFDILLHIGTLTVILIYFRDDIKKITNSLLQGDLKSEHGQFIPLIILGTIPTILIGLFLDNFIDSFENPLLLITSFFVCGLILYSSKINKEHSKKISFFSAVIIGVSQGIAIFPGISRSGVTIAIALMLGIERKKAFKFSFLLSIPTLIGALIYTINKDFSLLASSGLGLIEIFAGITTAIIVGYFSLFLLMNFVNKRKIHIFAYYCWVIAFLLLINNVLF